MVDRKVLGILVGSFVSLAFPAPGQAYPNTPQAYDSSGASSTSSSSSSLRSSISSSSSSSLVSSSSSSENWSSSTGLGKIVSSAKSSQAKTYEQECKENSVPVPPPIGGEGWTKLGEPISGDDLDLQDPPSDSAQLYQWSGPNGICVGLVRKLTQTGAQNSSQPKAIPGVICRSKDCKVCFYQTGLSTTASCTTCHSGSSPFIRNGATTDPINDLMARGGLDECKGYSPVRDDAPARIPTESYPNCNSCHRLGALNQDYCVSVLLPAIATGGRMPPAGEDPTIYTDEVRRLRAGCCEILGADRTSAAYRRFCGGVVSY